MKDLQVYLLAAGRGKRAGGPKAWVSFEGRSLLERQIAFLIGTFRPEGIVVTIQEDWRDRCRAIHPGVCWVSVNPEAPPLAALQAALKAKALSHWAYLYHVDMPIWDQGLFLMLSARIPLEKDSPIEALVPVCGGRGGHPLLLSPALGEPVAALAPAQARLDHWLRTREVKRTEVPYPCIHDNWNEGPPR